MRARLAIHFAITSPALTWLCLVLRLVGATVVTCVIVGVISDHGHNWAGVACGGAAFSIILLPLYLPVAIVSIIGEPA